MDWKSTIKGPHEQFHGLKFDDLDETKQFIENLPQLMQEGSTPVAG
jgi:hypothetical protein